MTASPATALAAWVVDLTGLNTAAGAGAFRTWSTISTVPKTRTRRGWLPAHPRRGFAALAEGQRLATTGSPHMADSMSPVRQMQTAEERIKQDALTRLREATPKEMTVFAEKLRREAVEAGATEDDLRAAESQI